MSLLAGLTDEHLARLRDEGWCVPLALARVLGWSVSEVLDAVGDLPFGRSQWWIRHAQVLGLSVGEPIRLPNLRAARNLPDGTYLIDSSDHLEAVTIPAEKVRGRWKYGYMEAYPVKPA